MYVQIDRDSSNNFMHDLNKTYMQCRVNMFTINQKKNLICSSRVNNNLCYSIKVWTFARFSRLFVPSSLNTQCRIKTKFALFLGEGEVFRVKQHNSFQFRFVCMSSFTYCFKHELACFWGLLEKNENKVSRSFKFKFHYIDHIPLTS